MLTGVAALLLVLGVGMPAASADRPADGPPQPDLPGGSTISVRMTTPNDGHAVSLLDPAHPAWTHLASTGAVARVTATVDLHGVAISEWTAHLDTPDAFQGVTPPDCQGIEVAPPQQVSCDFDVQATSGLNRLEFHFSANYGLVGIDTEGTITGGQFDWQAGWQVLDVTGRWSAIGRQGTVVLPATLTSALRYVVSNTGDIPFRATNACDDRLVAAHARLVCVERGVRPAQSLARDYHEQLRLVDVVGATAEPDIQASIRSVAGSLPFESSRAPQTADAAAPLWPWIAVAIVLGGGAVGILLLRGRRSRRRSTAG